MSRADLHPGRLAVRAHAAVETRRRMAAFTLCELSVVLAVVAALVALSLPSWKSAVQRARRADAHVALTQLQLAQERHRSNHPSYATLADLSWPATSAEGHYRLSVSNATAQGYVVDANAVGLQAADGACRRLRVVVDGLNTRLTSGPDESDNAESANRACWSR